MTANAPVHNSCALAVSSKPSCATVAIFLWLANWSFVVCLLRQPLSRSVFAGWLNRLPAAARVSLWVKNSCLFPDGIFP
jgi:hypothetical protein